VKRRNKGFPPNSSVKRAFANADGISRAIADAEKREALGPRKDPLHPMFRDHNCAYCASGEKPCRQGDPSRCDYPHARDD
jgi:hypothetical protein